MKTHIYTVMGVCGALLGIFFAYTSNYVSEIIVGAILITLCTGVLILADRLLQKKTSTSNIVSTKVTVKEKGRSILLIPIFLFAVGVALGGIRVQLSHEKIPYVCTPACTFNGVVITSAEVKGDYQTFHIRDENVDDKFYDLLVRAPLYPRYEVGSTLSLTGVVKVPSTIFSHDEKKTFDYVSYLATKNIGSEMYYPHIKVIDTDPHDIVSILERCKDEMVEVINYYVGSPASSLASGMLFGASSVTKELNQSFRVAGLSHIIVLSGFNIAIVISSILFVFAFLPLVLRIMLASVSVVIFVFMVGAEPSVIRATLMAFVSLLALLLGRVYVSRQALALSLFAIVMYSPESLLNDVSLHLSFLATAGIVYTTDIFDELLSRVRSQLIRSTLVTTLAAYVATAPYVMYTFGTFSTYAIISNMLVVPLVPFAMLLSFMVVVMSYISETATYGIGYIDTILITLMIWMGKVIEWLPLSSLSITVSYLNMILLYAVIICFTAFLSNKYLNRKSDETVITQDGTIISGVMKY